LIGNNATVLDNSAIGDYCVIGAGCVVSPGMKIPNRSFVLGAPGKIQGGRDLKKLPFVVTPSAFGDILRRGPLKMRAAEAYIDFLTAGRF
jgi:UDP-3-O-[3-hydroxymyristoyl] glucosamine N-acyltransferase